MEDPNPYTETSISTDIVAIVRQLIQKYAILSELNNQKEECTKRIEESIETDQKLFFELKEKDIRESISLKSLEIHYLEDKKTNLWRMF